MPIFRLRINDRTASISAWDPAQPLLYALRSAGIFSPKIGCGLGQCGTCTVLLEGEPVRSCVVPSTTWASAV